MPGDARLGDIWSGICCCHPPIPCIGMSGPIVTSSSDVFTNSRGQARCTDITIGWCGHAGIIVSCSGDTYTNNLGNARCGDAVTGCNIGTIVTCSGDSFTNG